MNIEGFKTRIIMSRPWIASCLMRLELKKSSHIPVMATDGVNIFYNPEGCQRFSEADIQFIILHEAFHCMMLHHIRIKNIKDKRLFNIAADYAINPLVRDFGLRIPNDALYNQEYEGKSVEWIYNHLLNNPNKVPQVDSDCLVLDHPGDEDDADEDKQSADWGQVLVDVFYNAKACGVIKSDSIDRHFKLCTAKSPDLLDQLSTLVSKQCHSDYSYKRPHRKIRGNAMVPSLVSHKKLDLVVIVDTSGSIGENDLGRFAAVLDSVRKTYIVDCDILSADTQVNSSSTFSYNDEIKWNLAGGGGTDFAKPLRYVKEKYSNPVVVYFTDGYCDSFGRAPEFPVLWASDLTTFTPPFGVKCKIQ